MIESTKAKKASLGVEKSPGCVKGVSPFLLAGAWMANLASNDGPNFASVGEDAVGTTNFSYGGEESEFYRRQLVPKADAEMALREFLTTGERPTCVEWEEV